MHDRQHYELVHWQIADDGLNYRRFFAVNSLAGAARRGPRGLRRLPRGDRALVRRGTRRRAPGRPPRRAARPRGYLDDLAAAHRQRLRAGREDPRDRRGAARLVGRPPAPPATTRWRGRPGAHRPGRPAGARRPRDPAARGARRLGGDDPRDQARGRRRHAELRGQPDHPRDPHGGLDRLDRPTARPTRRPDSRPTRSPTRSRSCSPASRSTAPTSPRAASTSTRPFALARTHRPDLADTLDVLLAACWPTPTAAPALRFQQTSGHGDGQGRRGHARSTAGPGSSSLNEVGGDPDVLRRSPPTTSTPRSRAGRPRGRTR